MKQHDTGISIRLPKELLKALKALDLNVSKEIRAFLESKVKKTKKAS